MNEIDWLTDRRPEPPAPDDAATAAARATLLRHAEARGPVFEEAPGPPAAAPAPDPAPRRSRRPRVARVLVGAAVVAGVGLVAAGTLPGGDDASGPIGAPPAAEAAPLVRLAAQIDALPAPSRGDATLVVRTTTDGDRRIVVYDLLRDDGRYAFGASLAELDRAADGRGQDGGRLRRILAAAAAATTLPDEEARVRLLAADRVDIDRIDVDRAAERRAVVDNAVWGLSFDALQMGAGDPEIRAGVMRLLATVPAVRVTARGATLEISNGVEILTVDARTGVPQRLVAAPRSGTTDADIEPGFVEYDVRRVDADELG